VDDNNLVRRVVIATGEVTTLAGQAGVSGSADGLGSSASFSAPYDVTTDGTYLYVADFSGTSVRKVEIATGAVGTLAGSTQGFVDGTGAEARFKCPSGITTDGESLFVADTCSLALRVVK